MTANAARLLSILTDSPERRLADLAGNAREETTAEDEAGITRALRLLKQDLALTLGLADIGGAIDLDQVTGALAGFADAALTASIRFCLNDLTRRGKFEPQRSGKTGGRLRPDCARHGQAWCK
jgi:glutamate-ammonia-ligase adenylyltransferase